MAAGLTSWAWAVLLLRTVLSNHPGFGPVSDGTGGFSLSSNDDWVSTSGKTVAEVPHGHGGQKWTFSPGAQWTQERHFKPIKDAERPLSELYSSPSHHQSYASFNMIQPTNADYFHWNGNLGLGPDVKHSQMHEADPMPGYGWAVPSGEGRSNQLLSGIIQQSGGIQTGWQPFHLEDSLNWPWVSNSLLQNAVEHLDVSNKKMDVMDLNSLAQFGGREFQDAEHAATGGHHGPSSQTASDDGAQNTPIPGSPPHFTVTTEMQMPSPENLGQDGLGNFQHTASSVQPPASSGLQVPLPGQTNPPQSPSEYFTTTTEMPGVTPAAPVSSPTHYLRNHHPLAQTSYRKEVSGHQPYEENLDASASGDGSTASANKGEDTESIEEPIKPSRAEALYLLKQDLTDVSRGRHPFNSVMQRLMPGFSPPWNPDLLGMAESSTSPSLHSVQSLFGDGAMTFPSASHEYTPSSSMPNSISPNTEDTSASATPVSTRELGTPVMLSVDISAPQPTTPAEALLTPPSGFVNVNEGTPGGSTVSIDFSAYQETSNGDPVQQPTAHPGAPTPHSQTSSFMSYKVIKTTGGAAPQSTTPGWMPYSRRYIGPQKRPRYRVRGPSAGWMLYPRRRINNVGKTGFRFAKQPTGFEASYIVKSFNSYNMGKLVYSKTNYMPLPYPHTQIKRRVKSM